MYKLEPHKTRLLFESSDSDPRRPENVGPRPGWRHRLNQHQFDSRLLFTSQMSPEKLLDTRVCSESAAKFYLNRTKLQPKIVEDMIII